VTVEERKDKQKRRKGESIARKEQGNKDEKKK
jgi:hypothetical protein